MTHQTCIQLPDEIYGRLKNLAQETGRSATYYIREAIEEYLDDLEDVHLAEKVLQRLKQDREKIISSEEFWNELDD